MNQATAQTSRRDFSWTQRGKRRVAEIIKASLSFNRSNGLRPASIRELARFAGFGENHTSVLKYSRAVVDDPNHFGDDCRVLRLISPYIYVAKGFVVDGDTLKVEHAIPDPKSAVPYSEQPGITYRDDWNSLVLLGEREADVLETFPSSSLGFDTRPLSSILQKVLIDTEAVNGFRESIGLEKIVEIIDGRYFPSESELRAISQQIGVPLAQLLSCRNYQYGIGGLDKSRVTKLGQVVEDFLKRTNSIKKSIWSLEELAKALKSDVSGLTVEKLSGILADDPSTLSSVTEADLSRMEKVFQDHDVPWTQEELLSILRIGLYLGTDQSPEEGNGKKTTKAINGGD